MSSNEEIDDELMKAFNYFGIEKVFQSLGIPKNASKELIIEKSIELHEKWKNSNPELAKIITYEYFMKMSLIGKRFSEELKLK